MAVLQRRVEKPARAASMLVVVFAVLAVLAVTTLMKGGAYTSSATPSASAVVLEGGAAAPAAQGGGKAAPSASAATASSAASAAALDSSATRALVFSTPYGRGAVQKLGEWRSSLFARMAEFYKAEEDAQTNHGAGGVGRVEPQGVRRYNLFDAIVDCPRGQVQRLGPPGDGGKFVCVDGVLDKLVDGSGGQERCAIYSIGSAGNYDFEEAMLQSTSCDVFTFDCTIDGRVLDAKRHQYHKICLGKESKTETINAFSAGAAAIADAQFMTYDQTTAMLNLSRVHLLKIDIEGYEFDVLSALKEANSCDLPLMIAMEVHFTNLYNGLKNPTDFSHLFWPMHDVSLGELAVFFSHFANLGYALISREDNPAGLHCCAEFTLLRVEQPAECKAFE